MNTRWLLTPGSDPPDMLLVLSKPILEILEMGEIQVTVKSLVNDGKDGLIKTGVIKPDEIENVYVLSSKDLYGKLKKGTYWIKIQNASKGNGYFTVKWN